MKMFLFFKMKVNYILFLFFLFFSLPIFALNVEETIKSTVENNHKIRIGLEKINESKELIKKATGELLPELSSTITGTYESKSTLQDDTFSDTYKLTVSQNLYDAGYNELEIERSKILYSNEILNFQILVENLILDAILGYLTVINYEKLLDTTNKNFEAVSKVLDETKTKFNLGVSTLYDLQIAESSFALAQANLFSANQNLLIGKRSFKRIVGLNAINLEDVIDINNDIDLTVIEDNTLKNNLSLKIIKNNIENIKILLLKEKKTKYPNLDLSANVEYSDTDRINSGTETTKGNIKFTLSIPIFQQGIDDSNIRKYHSQILQSELNLQDTIEDLMLNLANTYKDFKINESLMKANIASIKASETSLLSLKQEFSIGTKTISELISEEEKLLNTKVNYFNAKKDYLIAYFKIQSFEGTLLHNFKEYIPDIN